MRRWLPESCIIAREKPVEHALGLMERSRLREAIFEKAVRGQSLSQELNLLVDPPAVGGKGGKRQSRTQNLRTLRCAGAQPSEADGMAVETDGQCSVRASFERDMGDEPGG